MKLFKMVISILIIAIGTLLLVSSVTFSVMMKEEYAADYSGIGNYLLLLFLPSLFLIFLLIKQNRCLKLYSFTY